MLAIVRGAQHWHSSKKHSNTHTIYRESTRDTHTHTHTHTLVVVIYTHTHTHTHETYGTYTHAQTHTGTGTCTHTWYIHAIKTEPKSVHCKSDFLFWFFYTMLDYNKTQQKIYLERSVWLFRRSMDTSARQQSMDTTPIFILTLVAEKADSKGNCKKCLEKRTWGHSTCCSHNPWQTPDTSCSPDKTETREDNQDDRKTRVKQNCS